MSALAKKMLQLPRAADSVADLLWRLSDPAPLLYARTPVSDVVWAEQLMLGFPDRLAAFARLMNRPERVDLAASHVSVRAALVDNAHTATDLLATLAADPDPAVAEKASARLDVHRRFLADPSDLELATAVVKANYASVLAELCVADRPAALKLLAAFETNELHVRGIVFDILAEAGVDLDPVLSALVGALDSEFAAHVVDHEIISWLVSSESFHAEVSRDVVVESLGTKKAELATTLVLRATAEASDLLAGSSLYENRPHPRQRELKLPPHAKWLDASMVDSMRDSGLPPQALAALVFNSIGELPERVIDEVFAAVAESSPPQALSFLLGQLTRRPDRSDVRRLLDGIDEPRTRALADTYAKVAVNMNGRLPDVPWRLELLRHLPGLFCSVATVKNPDEFDQAMGDVAGTGTAAAPADDDLVGIDRRFREVLGPDASAWEFAIALAGEWEQSLDALLDAARLA